jgi:Ion channel
MTTIGYGNQSPISQGGRAMVYTVGFVCILAFASILVTAGYIVTAIFDDGIRRIRLDYLNAPWIGCLFWSVSYYAWMLVIAGLSTHWQHVKLGEEFDFADGYWFAYISTTTVGLGDVVLQPEVIVGRDLVVFPLIFLIGFVFLSAFIGKIMDAVNVVFGGKTTLLETLVAQMDSTNFFLASWNCLAWIRHWTNHRER